MIYTNIDLALIYLLTKNKESRNSFYILKDPIGQSTFQVTWFVIRSKAVQLRLGPMFSCALWRYAVLGYVGPAGVPP